MNACVLILSALLLTSSADGKKLGGVLPGPDQSPPAIGSMRVDVHGNGRATFSWRSDEPTRASLSFGFKPTAIRTVLDNRLSTEHSIEVTGLFRHVRYYYQLHATDAANNRTVTEVASFMSGGVVSGNRFEISGKLEAWHPTTISFAGPMTNELATSPNPFLDYRLNVVVTSPDGYVATIPGYYDGDGAGGGTGNVWRVRFPAFVEGSWSFVAHFDQGTDVAISLDPDEGTPTSFDGTTGTFEILPRDPDAEGFYKWGKLRYIGDHYMKFWDGPYFIKGGSNSPENLLAYAGFDNTVDQGGLNASGLEDGLHEFAPHRGDWGPASRGGLGNVFDPLFTSADTGKDSRGIIGALNYLGAAHVNSLFILPMNLGGDGWEICPFVGYSRTAFDKTHYDISKLAQWQEVLEHSARREILIQFILAETEAANENWLDGGAFGRERKLFFREMIARFGHLPAIKWNLSEECDFPTTMLQAFAGYITQLDPYRHPIGFHVNLLPVTGESAQWDAVLGDPRFATNSIQAIPWTASSVVEKWRNDSSAAGRKWVVGFDEQLRALDDTNADQLRKLMLYDVLFSGGNVEWYCGYTPLPLGGDIRIENFRTRDAMWNYTWHARDFLESNLPFWIMKPMDGLVQGEAGTYGGAEVFAFPGYYYAIYYGDASQTGTLDLTSYRGTFRFRWFNPRTGEFATAWNLIRARQHAELGPPPSDPSEDWVLLVERDRIRFEESALSQPQSPESVRTN